MSNFFTPDLNNESAIAPWNTSLEATPGIIPKLDANRTLTGGVGQEVNIPTLTPNTYDNIILPDASPTLMAKALTTDSNLSLQDSSVDLLTGQAMSEVYEDLSKFAAEPDFVTKMNVAFGENWDAAGAKALAEGWFNRDFSAIPPVKVVSSAEIGGANGAFAAATDTIYLSKEFLAQNGANPAAVADVLLEEIGHSVDARLNVTDSPGDEGAIFAAVVQGKELSQGELKALKSEDDTATVILDGKAILIEQDNTTSAARNIGTLNGTQTFTDFVGDSDPNDYYRFSLNSTSNFSLNLNGLTANADVWLLDGNGNGMVGSNNTGTTAESINRTLNSGTYYVQVFRGFPANTNYNLRLTGTPVGDGNDTLNTASGFNAWFEGNGVDSTNASSSIGGSDLNDYYTFSLNNTRQVDLTLKGLQADADLQLLDKNGTVIQSSTKGYTSDESITRTLNAGQYFIRVYPSGNATTNYNLNLALTTLQTQVPANNWKAEYFNNINLTGTPVFVENLGDGSQGFSKNWGNSSPPNTPSDNFSARITTQRYLAPGLYQIKTQADDGIRVQIKNQTVVDQSTYKSFATNSGYFRSNGETVPIEVDYSELGGGAALNFNIIPATKFQDSVNPSQQWKATVYSWNSSQGSAPPTNFWDGDINNPNAIGVISLGSNTRSDGKKGINANWGTGAPNGDNNRLPHDFFAMRAYTQATFDGGSYKFRVQGDDGFQLFAKNQTGQLFNITSPNQWTQSYSAQEITSQLPAGQYDMYFNQYEANGDARFDLSWEKMGNPKLDIQLSYPKGGFTQSEINQMEKAAQNWERIITKDKDSSGVLKISIVKGLTDPGNVAQTNQESAFNSRTNFSGPDVDINGVDYHNNIRFNPNDFSRMVSNNLLVPLTMHEIGHTLGLYHEDGVSLMNHLKFNAPITNSMYNTLTAEGYGIDRTVPINWS